MKRPIVPQNSAVTLRRQLLSRLKQLSAGTTMCPGQLARDCGTVLAKIRGELSTMATEGTIRITQRGKKASLIGLKGPFRVSLPTSKGTEK